MITHPYIVTLFDRKSHQQIGTVVDAESKEIAGEIARTSMNVLRFARDLTVVDAVAVDCFIMVN